MSIMMIMIVVVVVVVSSITQGTKTGVFVIERVLLVIHGVMIIVHSHVMQLLYLCVRLKCVCC